MAIGRRTVLRGMLAGTAPVGAAARVVAAKARDTALVIAPCDRPGVSGDTYERLRVAHGGGVRLTHGEPVSLQQPWYRPFVDREFEVTTDGLWNAVVAWWVGVLSTARLRSALDAWRSGEPMIETVHTDETNE